MDDERMVNMSEFLKSPDTLACESGGVIPPETLAAQGIKGIAVFLADGSVAVYSFAASMDGAEGGAEL